MGKSGRNRANRLSLADEKMARRLLKSNMEKGYRVCLDEAVSYTQVAMAREEITKDKYFESVTRAMYYTAWGDCERNMEKDQPVGLNQSTKELIQMVAEFKEIPYDEAEKLLMGETDTMDNFLKGCRNLGVGK